MSKKWFCQVADQEIGPISSSELKALAAEGKLGPDDLVRKDGQEGWATASQVKGLTFTTSAISPVTPSASTTTPVETTGPPRLPSQRPPPMVRSDRPSRSLSSKGEASTETRPKGSGAADEIKRVARSWLGHIGPVVKRVLQESRNVAVATWEQGVRIARYAVARWELRRASRGAEEARFAHGKKLYEAGAGDPELIRQIAELTQQIDDKEAPGEVRETLKRRHRELTIRLSKSAEPSANNLPPSARAEQSDVTAAAGTHEKRIAACDSTKAALWPQTGKERQRVIVGSLGVTVVILMVGLWTISQFGRGDSSSQNVLATIELASPPKPSTDVIVPEISRTNGEAEERLLARKDVARAAKAIIGNTSSCELPPLEWNVLKETVSGICESVFGRPGRDQGERTFGIKEFFVSSPSPGMYGVMYSTNENGVKANKLFLSSNVFSQGERQRLHELLAGANATIKEKQIGRLNAWCATKGRSGIIWGFSLSHTGRETKASQADIVALWDDIVSRLSRGDEVEFGNRDGHAYLLFSGRLLLVKGQNCFDILFPARDEGFRMSSMLLVNRRWFTKEENEAVAALLDDEPLGGERTTGRFRITLREPRSSKFDTLPSYWIRVGFEPVATSAPIKHAVWDWGQGTLDDLLTDKKWGAVVRRVRFILRGQFDAATINEEIRTLVILADDSGLSTKDVLKMWDDAEEGCRKKGLNRVFAVRALSSSLGFRAAVDGEAYDTWKSRKAK